MPFRRPEAIRSFAWRRKRISRVIMAMIIRGGLPWSRRSLSARRAAVRFLSGERPRQIENGILFRPADDGLHIRRLDDRLLRRIGDQFFDRPQRLPEAEAGLLSQGGPGAGGEPFPPLLQEPGGHLHHGLLLPRLPLDLGEGQDAPHGSKRP